MHRQVYLGVVLGIAASMACAGCEQAAEPPAGEAARQEHVERDGERQPGAESGQAEGAAFADADEFLTALEESGKNLVMLTAGLKYDRTFELQGDRQIRTGRLYFVGGKPDPQNPDRRMGRKFAIVFDRLWLGDEMREDPRTYIFDGMWLVERMPAEKLQLRKQIVGPGESFDPLKIGEGPLPIPIGQPKAEIRQRYDVELLPPTDGINPDAAADAVEARLATEMLRMAAKAQQIRLVPKTGREEDDDFTEIRLWYTRDRQGELLPRMARTVNRSGDVSVVQLIGLQAQHAGGPENPKAKVPEEVFDTTLPQGWTEDEQRLRTPERGEAPGEGGVGSERGRGPGR